MLYVLCWSFFFFKQKTAYEMRISDWSSDVCSSDLLTLQQTQGRLRIAEGALAAAAGYRPDVALPPADWNPLAAHIEMPSPTLAELMTRAPEARPELLAAQARQQAAAGAVRASLCTPLPPLCLPVRVVHPLSHHSRPVTSNAQA